MLDRKALLANLDVGDIFHAEAPNSASLICLVVSASKTTLRVRRITSQDDLMFDRRTDQTPDGDVIDSVEPLLAEIHNAFLELIENIKNTTRGENPDNSDRLMPKKRALRFVGPHYSSNPLPSTDC